MKGKGCFKGASDIKKLERLENAKMHSVTEIDIYHKSVSQGELLLNNMQFILN